MNRVLITGATGFVGQALRPALAKAGMPVVVATRNPSAAGPMPGVDVRAITGVGPRVDWSAVLRDVDTVVHLAARTPVLNEIEDKETTAAYQRINADGAHKLALDCAEAGIRRLVFVSTAKVHGEHSPAGEAFSESSPLQPGSAYAHSKVDAERRLAEVAETHGMELVIMRPPLIYGPGVQANFLSLLKLVAKAPVLPVGGIRNGRSLIHVGNFADAVVRVIGDPRAAGQTYLVRDGEDLSTPALLGTIAKAMSRNVAIPKVPVFMLGMAAGMTGKTAALDRLKSSFLIDDGKIRRDLGWTAPITVLQGIEETVAWFTKKVGRS